ncbi:MULTISPECIES: DUF2306 domain-containing protein [Delftia]|uniref:DUF2306 domain-containing protein n=1 Tax=Delftia TaxID=80865 RepID=UPI000649228F|nr:MULTISPECIES: DUF2306 domain-containing protein [Delftia]MDC2857291.1 DUF2306 domain-containing protein [Delftia sp. DT-2]MDH0774651.1 DUF2306 domain-containing protein [Delftia tsuruhatensis]MDH1458863.1 DUF2306 domain-containing protein [Delftia tsuruhatensis]MDH1827430.1 DUF2306 domain-containing protein [Delftia tsuruhatensis]MXN29704.1 DUF2306 domain-containing protein [Delftia sp. CH05]
MQMTPLIAIHMSAALGATATGAIALLARRQAAAHPRLHRAAGHAFVTLMVCAAVSACFIRDYRLPNWGGYTPVHLLVPLTFAGLGRSFWHLYHGNIAGHRKIMRSVYIGACVVAGLFTLLPGRYLGDLLWQRLGLA